MPARARLAELRGHLSALPADPAWRRGWEHRLGIHDAAERVLAIGAAELDDYATAIDRGDLASLPSREAWFRRLVSGEQFDSVHRK